MLDLYFLEEWLPGEMAVASIQGYVELVYHNDGYGLLAIKFRR